MSYDHIYNKVLDMDLFTESVKVAEYLCPICTGVYFNPVVDGCGHVFCRECILKWFATTGSIKVCPIFKTAYDSNLEEKVIRPLILVQEILEKLEVKCKNKCEWVGKLRDLFLHMDNDCRNTYVNCRFFKEGCHLRFLRNEKNKHEEVCEFKPHRCANCHSLIPLNNMKSHLDECPNVRIDCPKKCCYIIERCEIESHIKNLCENTEVDCIFYKLGCEKKVIRKEFKEHNAINSLQHELCIINSIVNLSEKIEKISQNLQNLTKLDNSSLSINNQISRYDEIIDNYNKKKSDSNNFNKKRKNNSTSVNNMRQPKKKTSALGNTHTKAHNHITFNGKTHIPSFINNKRERVDKNNSSNELNSTKILKKKLGIEEEFNFNNDISSFDHSNLPLNSNNNFEDDSQIYDLVTECAGKVFSPLILDNTYISKGLNVNENRVTNLSQVKNEHKFVFANLILNNGPIDAEYIWKIKINRKSIWLAFGCCQKEKVISNNYKFVAHMREHGCFMISSNGYSWNTNNDNENNYRIQSIDFPQIENGDEILIKYKPAINEIIFSFNEVNYVLHSVSCPKGNFLVPCVIFINYLDDVSFYVMNEI